MIKVPQNIIDKIAGHAKQEAPLEACGYLAGKDGEVQEIFRMTNIDKSPEHFSFDPKEQFKVIKEARTRGLQLIAVYHSHPSSPARLSQEDIALAHDPSMGHIIYSLLSNEARAFSVIDGKIIPHEIKVV
jgi:proteasome lid subunit RPN8/RPN11